MYRTEQRFSSPCRQAQTLRREVVRMNRPKTGGLADFRFGSMNEPALAGGRWPGGWAHCVYRSSHLNERR
jgi:hypothetical protein